MNKIIFFFLIFFPIQGFSKSPAVHPIHHYELNIELSHEDKVFFEKRFNIKENEVLDFPFSGPVKENVMKVVACDLIDSTRVETKSAVLASITLFEEVKGKKDVKHFIQNTLYSVDGKKSEFKELNQGKARPEVISARLTAKILDL